MTAKEFLLKEIPDHIKREGFSFGDLNSKIIEKAMIECTKFYVQEALKSATEKAELRLERYSDDWYIDNSSILNAYPMENIK